MKYFEMFAGIGGFRYGIEKAIPNAECVGFSEIDKWAIKIYRKNYRETKNYGDAKRIIPEELPDIDLLVGGFPCQAFSFAGKHKGFQDARGTLFFDVARILKHKRPRYILLENVWGLLSHEFGKTFQTILRILANIGYVLQWEVLDSDNFSVPQNRKRVFIIGHFRGECAKQIFPVGIKNKRSVKVKKSSINIPVITPGISNKRQNGRIFKDNESPMFSLTAMHNHGIYDGKRIRLLTPTECERLQSFPDGWTEGISDTQRYKCLGNAVTTTVITEITKKFFIDDKNNA